MTLDQLKFDIRLMWAATNEPRVRDSLLAALGVVDAARAHRAGDRRLAGALDTFDASLDAAEVA